MNDKPFNWNTAIGFLLIGGIFLYFGYFNQQDQEPDPGQKDDGDSTQVVEETRELQEVDSEQVDSENVASLDSISNTNENVTGLAAAARGVGELFTIENEVLELTFSSKGGKIVKARLKDYQTWDSLPLYLINENADFNVKINDGGAEYNSADLNFTPETSGGNSIAFNLSLEGKSLRYEYQLQPDNYMLDWEIESRGMADNFAQDAGLQWEMKTLRHEKNAKVERDKTQMEYRFADDDDVDDLSSTSEAEELEENIRWVAMKQQFFSTILLNREGGFDRAGMKSVPIEEGEEFTKLLAAKVALPEDDGELEAELGLYLGPNKYDVLKAYDEDFDELIPLGWGILGWINKGLIINMFDWLERNGLNYGLIILIIALVIKLILFPLTYQSYRSMAKMRVLKPEIDELNEKFKDKEPMKKQQATMELYRKAGVNPLGGCIPVLFQMPILLALFQFFPASIELRQQGFLWADDLSTYDSIMQLPFTIPFYGDHVSLFTLLMTVSTIIYTYMNQQMTGQNQQMPQLKYLMYLMPIIFLGVFNSYASGLSYYYFVANMITFGQQFAIRASLDDEKIHAKIQEKKKQPKKENRLMRRMREMQEQQEQRTRAERRKK